MRNALLVSTLILAIGACGGKKPQPTETPHTDTGSGSAVATTEGSAATPGSAAEGSAAMPPPPPEKKEEPPPPPPPPEKDAFLKLSTEEKTKIMQSKVLPAMTKDFKKYDAKRFAKFGCKTCHGKGGEKGGDFKMPNPDLPVLDFAAIKDGKQDPKMAKWMGEVVKPEMAKLLGLEPWDEKHPTGFGCNACHMIKGE